MASFGASRKLSRAARQLASADPASRAHFEVRCPRCSVTFAAETKKCIHCDGRTVPSGTRVAGTGGGAGIGSGSATPIEIPGFELGPSSTSVDPSRSESPAAWPPMDAETEIEAFEPEEDVEVEVPASPGRSVLGGLGSFLWIAMLIAFSLSSRMCGE